MFGRLRVACVDAGGLNDVWAVASGRCVDERVSSALVAASSL